MHKFVVPRLSGVLQKRQETISANINEAEYLRDKASKDNTDYTKLFADSRSKAFNLINDASKRANMTYEEGIAHTEEKLKKDIDSAEKDINLELSKVEKDLNKNLPAYISEVVEKISGISADKSVVDKIIAKIK